MTLVERILERRSEYYGSQHDELRRVLEMAIARIEAADDVIEHGNAESYARHRALVREQEGK